MKKTTLPSNEILLYVLAAATAVTLTWALIYIDGGQADPWVKVLVFIRGGLVGFVSGLATAIVSSRAMRVMSKGPKVWAIYSLAGMLGVELVIVSAVTYSTMTPEMTFCGDFCWPLRALIALCAGAFIPLVAVGLTATSGALQAETQPERPVAQVEKQKKKTAEQVAQPAAPVAQVAKPELNDENLIAHWLRNPTATNEALAQVFGVSHTTIGNRRKAMIESGRIRKVGKEIKVLPVMVVQDL
jgi:hypothetical protein